MKSYPFINNVLAGFGIVTTFLLCAALAVPVPAGAMVPNIDPVVDVDRLAKVDAQSLAVYLRIMESAPDLEAMVPNAGDFANVVYIDPSVAVSGSGASPEDPLKSWTEASFVNGTAYLQKCGT